jgi:hypothetical protein
MGGRKMATKSKSYQQIKFNYDVITRSYKEFLKSINSNHKGSLQKSWEVQYVDTKWELDSESQFVNEYIKEEILEASFRCYTSNEAKFSINFSNYSYEDPKTRVSISLADRDRIEKIFDIFEASYNDFLVRLNDTAKSDDASRSQIAPRYSFEKTLPSTYVEKRLLVDLEHYILQRAKNLEAGKIKIPDYNVTILDSTGTMTLKSIESYPRDVFDNEIEYITLSCGDSYKSIMVYVRFGKTKEKSKIEISYKGENAREIVESIKVGILHSIKDSQTWNFIYHPNFIVVAILINVLLFSAGALLYAVVKQGIYSQRAIAITLLLLAYLVGSNFKPYTTFDTRRNETIRKWSGWLVETVLGILLIWLVATLFPPLVP